MNTLLSFGHGYSARALATRLRGPDWRIIGTTRSAEKAREIEAAGCEALIWPGDNIQPALRDATHLLISAGPDQDGDPLLLRLRDHIAARAQDLEWFGYLSTTGVYGDHGGAWVDEDTPLTPSTTRGAMRVAAEADWQSVAGLPLHIFRLAGIYGPGRGPFEKVRSGKARRIVKEGQVFSRIHVDDIAQILQASIARPRPGAIYNLCDDDPAPPQDVIAYAAELLAMPTPPAVAFADADLSPMARSFYAESKRVSNARIKEELNVSLTYPNYRIGLEQLLQDDRK